jgi:hypothetical protein
MQANTAERTLTHPTELLNKPKAYFLVAGLLSFLLSVYLWFSGDRELGIFVGLWVPSICSAGALILAGGRHD